MNFRLQSKEKSVEIHPADIADKLTEKHGKCYSPPPSAEKSGCNSNTISDNRHKGKEDKPIAVFVKFGKKFIDFFLIDSQVFFNPFNFSESP